MKIIKKTISFNFLRIEIIRFLTSRLEKIYYKRYLILDLLRNFSEFSFDSVFMDMTKISLRELKLEVMLKTKNQSKNIQNILNKNKLKSVLVKKYVLK